MADAPKPRPTADAAQTLMALAEAKIADPIARCEILIAAIEYAGACTCEAIEQLHAKNMRSIAGIVGKYAAPGDAARRVGRGRDDCP